MLQMLLLLILVSQFGQISSGVSLLNAVQQLNRDLRSEMNVYINTFDGLSEELDILLHNVQLPRIYISNSKINFTPIHEHFNSKTLTVVFLNETNITTATELVHRLFWTLHFRDVIYVWFDKILPSQREHFHKQLESLFTQCWTNGFTNVLVYAHGELYSYHPFPHIEVVHLPRLSAYHNKAHLYNFQKYVLRCPILMSSPRCYEYTDKYGQLRFSGYYYKIVKTFIEHYNGVFVEAVLPTKFVLLPAIIEAFERKQIDLLPTMLYQNPNHSHSVVIQNMNVYIMVPQARPLPNYLYFLKPFSNWLWLSTGFLVLYAASVWAIISWHQQQRFDFSICLLNTLNDILYISHFYRNQSTKLQLTVHLILVATGFILTNLYLSILSSMLTSRLHEPQITTIDGIRHTNLFLPQTVMDVIYMRNISGIPPIAIERMIPSSPETVHYLRRDLNTSFLISGAEDKVDFYMYQQKFLPIPIVRVIYEILYSLQIFIPVPHGSPFLQLLNTYLRRICDTGILQKMFRSNEEDGIASKEIRFFKPKPIADTVLSFRHFRVPLIVWGIGLFLGTICFLMEYFRLSVFKCTIHSKNSGTK